MGKKVFNVYPGLASQMAYHYHDNKDLAEILGISYDSVLRRVTGNVDFELSEIKKLMMFYKCDFKTLFEEVAIKENVEQKGA